ncbi:MAG: ATPase [Eubacterium sp.]|jgi:F0F1-type ATP synthase membrane subunit b/b'|nr:ATPase [Eubacterium sp.]
MNPSRIEKAIDEIYEYVENCKPSKLYPNKVTVSKDELYDLLDALRMCAPEEIKRYQKIINNREEILGQAQEQAQQIMSQAQAQTKQLLDQSELVQTAYVQAEQILKEAETQAQQILNQAVGEGNQVRTDALYYTSDLLGEAGRNIELSLKEIESKSSLLINVLKKDIETIKNNRSELQDQITGKIPDEDEAAKAEQVEGQ